jgi:predicted transcriptional regulator
MATARSTAMGTSSPADKRLGSNNGPRTIILSVQPKWATLIQSGQKSIEIRKRFPRHLAALKAYIYETSPRCELTAAVQMGSIHELPVEDLWRIYGKASCVEEQCFAAYFRDRNIGVAVEITKHVPLTGSWKLQHLREVFGFTAPQSWAYASPLLVEAIAMSL